MVAMTGASSNKVVPVKHKPVLQVPEHIKIDSATSVINKLIELDLPKTP